LTKEVVGMLVLEAAQGPAAGQSFEVGLHRASPMTAGRL